MDALPIEAWLAIIRQAIVLSSGSSLRFALVCKTFRDLAYRLTRYHLVAENLNLYIEWAFSRPLGRAPRAGGWGLRTPNDPDEFEKWVAKGERASEEFREALNASVKFMSYREVTFASKWRRGAESFVERGAVLEKCRAVDGGEVVVGLGGGEVTLSPDLDGYVWLGLFPRDLSFYFSPTIRSVSGVDVQVRYYSNVRAEDACRLMRWEGPVDLYVGGKEVTIANGMAVWVHPDDGGDDQDEDQEPSREDQDEVFSSSVISFYSGSRSWLPSLLGRLIPEWS